MLASERRKGGVPAATLDDRLGTIESATTNIERQLDGLAANQREQADAVIDESIDRRVGIFERGSRHFDRRVGPHREAH